MNRFSPRQRALALTLTIAAVVLVASPALAHPVKFWNSSAYVITEFYSKPAGRNNWGNDILGNGVREPGQYLNLSHTNQCYRDLGVMVDNEWWYEFPGVNLCELERIDFLCNTETCWVRFTNARPH